MQNVRRLIKFHIVLNVIVVLFVTGASYIHTPLQGGKDTLIYLGHLLILQSSIAGMLYFLSLNKWTFRLLFGFLFIILCCFSFWAYTQDMSFTTAVIQATIETKLDIAIDLLTWPYLAFILVAVVAVILLSKWRDRINMTAHWKVFGFLALGCVGLHFLGERLRPQSFQNRMPYSIYKGLKQYLQEERLILATDIGKYTTALSDAKVVLIIGETVRADHLSINGYQRETTPFLASREDIISFHNLRTIHTNTGKSVPQLLTNIKLEEAIDRPIALYDVARLASITTTWIGNQTLEKSFEPIVMRNENVTLIDEFKSEFSFHKAYDTAMLPYLEERLEDTENQLITLHMMGSHWWYENRYPENFRKFRPVINSKYIPSNTNEEMLNSYDNTLVFLDYFLNSVIERLERREGPNAMIYVADHGEMLGEGGKWLHAQAGDEVKNPAYIMWFSQEYKQRFPNIVEKFSDISGERVSTDVIYDNMIKILGIYKEGELPREDGDELIQDSASKF